MIRTVVRPINTDLHLSIPEDFIGKQVEVLLYTIDEVEKVENASKLRGKLNLSDKQYHDFCLYLKDVRNEWNRNI